MVFAQDPQQIMLPIIKKRATPYAWGWYILSLRLTQFLPLRSLRATKYESFHPLQDGNLAEYVEPVNLALFLLFSCSFLALFWSFLDGWQFSPERMRL